MRVPPRKSNRRERCSINRVVSTLLVLAVLAVTGSIKLAVRVHSGSNNLQEQTHILITLEERPLSSSRLSVMSQADASRSLTHQSRDQEHSNASQEQSQRIRPLTNATSSACMLIMDDNHWLVEWLAYHYTTMNLRHMIIAIDERSKTSPIEILDRYKGRINFELWNDTHFFRNKPDGSLQEINLARQQTFLAKCMHTLKLRPETSWTMFTDTDEFIVINRRTKQRGHGNFVRPSTVVPL